MQRNIFYNQIISSYFKRDTISCVSFLLYLNLNQTNMKKIIALIILISSFANAQVYEILLETKNHPEYTPEFLEKMYGNIKDPEVRKWNID